MNSSTIVSLIWKQKSLSAREEPATSTSRALGLVGTKTSSTRRPVRSWRQGSRKLTFRLTPQPFPPMALCAIRALPA